MTLLFQGYPTLEAILAAATLCSVLLGTAVIATRRRLHVNQPCLIGFGLLPFCVCIAFFSLVPSYGSTLPVVSVVIFVIAPNFLVAFLISALVLMWKYAMNTLTRPTIACPVLFLVHAVGLAWATILATHDI